MELKTHNTQPVRQAAGVATLLDATLPLSDGLKSRKTAWSRTRSAVVDCISSPFTRLVYGIYGLQPRSHPYLLAPVIGWFIRTPLRISIKRKMRLFMADQNWTRPKETKIWREHLRHVGLNVLEPDQLYRKSPAAIRSILSIEGEENLTRALDEGRGVILFINHVGPSSCVPLLARFGHDITVAGDAMLVPHLERKLQFVFNTIGAKRVVLGDRVPVRAANVFRQNGIFATYTDLSTTPRHTAWVPFGPAEIRVPVGPAVLALRHRVPVLYVNSIRLPGHRFRLQISAPLTWPEPGELPDRARALMAEASAHLIQAVRARPEQWWALDYVRVRDPRMAEPAL